MNKRLIAAVFVGSLGGFVFGYDLGALSAATQTLRDDFGLSPWVFGLTISSSVWGTVCGSILAGRFADRIGRQNLIGLCSILYSLAALAITLPVSSEWVLVLTMRFLCGIAIGGFTVGCPLYLSEIAPISMRGRVVSVFQLQVGVGVIVAFSVGAVAVRLAATSVAWRWCLGLGAAPAIILLLLARLMPQIAPQVSEGERGSPSMLQSPRAALEHPDPRLFRRKNSRLILVATSIAVFNQLSGVNILLLYMLDILASTGMNASMGHRYTVLIACLSLVTTVIGMLFVDRLGRKPILYVGSAVMALCMVMLGLTIPHHLAPLLYLSVLVAYNAFFAFSQGTVVWVYLSELFPPGLRGVGQGYGSSVHWIANAILISVFPRVQKASSIRSFYVFASMMVLQIVVIWLWYPETRGTALGSFAQAQETAQDRLH